MVFVGYGSLGMIWEGTWYGCLCMSVKVRSGGDLWYDGLLWSDWCCAFELWGCAARTGVVMSRLVDLRDDGPESLHCAFQGCAYEVKTAVSMFPRNNHKP